MHILTNVSYAADGKVYAGQPSRFENKKDAVYSAKRQLAEDFGITMEEVEESAQEGGDPYVISMSRDGRFEAYTVAEMPSQLRVSTHGSKGYKVFKPNWTCKGYRYKVGETYTMKAVPVLYDRGFHFCERLADCFGYYEFDPNNKVAEIEAVGEVVSGDNGKISCTNMITIVRELTWEEVLRTVNTGKFCTGVGNCGNYNSGHGNSGSRNSGNWNSGYCNSGDLNSGKRNCGNMNSGNGNSGYWNCGNYNSGHGNSGDFNSGSWNSGNGNSGDFNSGSWNSGDWNSGDWNSGNWNCGDWNATTFSAGCFCTEEPKILLFNRPSDWTLRDWRNSDARRLLDQIPSDGVEWYCTSEMTEKEKEAHPEHETTGGYLKTMMHTKTAQKWWDGLADEEKNVITSLPNFNAALFKECTGIDTSCPEAE